jgi:GNAT superfamily N-acetyltransferase
VFKPLFDPEEPGMAVEFKIRTASLEDAQAVSEVYLSSRKKFIAFAPLVHSDEDVIEWIAQQLLPAGGVRVAVLRHEIIGMMALSDDGAFRWIDHLYLKPEYTQQGYGSLLINAALAELRPPIRLYTFQANEGARRFYEKFGFIPIEYGDGSGNEEHCPDVLYERAT